MDTDYLNDLNKDQKEAVLYNSGPILILAGAGTGKTKTLTNRILHLIKKEGVSPENILAITFTNKAAKEMKERVESLMTSQKGLTSKNEILTKPAPAEAGGGNDRFPKPFVSTFHALGVKILRENSRHLDVPRHFSIYDRNDSVSLVKKILKEIGEDPKRIESRNILSIISKEKGKMITCEQFSSGFYVSTPRSAGGSEKELNQNPTGNRGGGSDYMRDIVSRVWEKYDSYLRKEKAFDFDDLLLETALLLKNNKEIRSFYQNKWQHVHIDEYQDTNEVQYQIAKMITGENNNICVVGDIDQNIYSWRGATIKNIVSFEKDFKNSKVIILEQNYRSTGNILEAANSVIANNQFRKEKNLYTENKSGEKISLYNAFDEADEARFVTEKIEELIESGVSSSEIAVLYRANFQSRILEEYFLDKALPYQVLGTRFFDRKEVKDVLSYIKSALNPNDLSSLERIINTPTRGIGKVTFLKIAEGNENHLSGKAKENVSDFRNLLKEIRKEIEEKTPEEVIKYIIKKSGLEKHLKEEGEEGIERLENIKELATLAKKYETLPKPEGIEKILEDAALATDQDELEKETKGTKLMTVHASKGLEFNYVFITGLEEGLFPHESFENKKIDEQLEEERRLFYVAITRARKKVYLSYAGIRTIYGSQSVNIPSEFINEIDDHLLETIEDEGRDDVSSQVKKIFIEW
jgi:DNA helicase II / ATP-dependent DNA helicase PcrA